ncbi:MAG: ABC transporter substrate-binding protein [Flavobacteriales bacterium]|nr:ABC transporter substrate-binding protein [Flavobacteriales bacterium]
MKAPDRHIREAAEQAGALVPLRVAGVPEHFNLPWLLGLERRAFVRAGVEVKWHTVPEGTGAMCKLLREGEVDIAMLVTEGAVRDILNGNPSRIIASYVDSPLTWGVHVGAGSGIASADGLKGVPYAISRPNSGSHLVALSYAHDKGWPVGERDLEVVNDLEGALERMAKPGPIAFLWEKFTTKPYVDSGALRRVDEYRASWPSFVIVATEAVLQAHPKEIGRLLKVIRDQAAGLMAKKTAPEIFAQRYDMKLEDAQEWFAGVRWNTGAPLEEATLAKVVSALTSAGFSDMPASGEGLVERLLWQVAVR